MVVGSSFPEVMENKIFRAFLTVFINFPHDNMVTTYKWNQLTLSFGFKTFYQEFVNHVTDEGGFIGLANSIAAEKLLAEANKGTYVIRWSRTYPEILTFSVKDINGKISHVRNERQQGKPPITLSQFKETHLKGYKPVPFGLDVSLFKHVKNLNAYVMNPKQFYTTFQKEAKESPKNQESSYTLSPARKTKSESSSYGVPKTVIITKSSSGQSFNS